jgi:hypothetical protein
MSREPGGVVTPVFSTWSCRMYDVEEDYGGYKSSLNR